MSERGSFVTEYIYCDKCFKSLENVLIRNNKYLCSQKIQSWEGDEKFLPIIAGKVGGTYSGSENNFFDVNIRDEIQEAICCDLKIAIIPDGSKDVLMSYYKPNKKGENA